MIQFSDITSFDYIITLVVLIFVIRGAWIGFMRQLTTFLALIGSYWLSGRYIGEAIPYVQQVVDNPKIVFLASFAILFILSALIFILAGKVLHRVMEISLLGWFDRFLGILLGVAKGAVVTVLAYMILATTLSSSNHLFDKSLTVPYLNQGADLIRTLIQDPKVRKLFVIQEPAIKKEKVEKKDAAVAEQKKAPVQQAIPAAPPAKTVDAKHGM
jgi:membrane protein required for colicin V production